MSLVRRFFSSSRSLRHVYVLGTQGVLSAGNFAINLFIARADGPGIFGQWAWMWLFIYGVSAIHNAVVQSPLLAMPYTRAGALSYTRVRIFFELGALISILLSSIAGLCCYLFQPQKSSEWIVLSVATAFITFANCNLEFLRRVAYLRGQEFRAFLLEGVRQTVSVGFCLVFFLRGAVDLNLQAWVVAGSAALCALGYLGLVWAPARSRPVRAVWRRAFDLNRWIAPLSLSQRLGGDLVSFVTSGLLGASALGGLRGVQQVLQVTSPINMSLQSTLISDLSRLSAQAKTQELRSAWIQITCWTAVATLFGMGVFWLCGGLVINHLLSPAYASYRPAFNVLVLGSGALIIGLPSFCMLMAIHRPRLVLVANLTAGLFTAATVFPSLYFWKVFGAACSITGYYVLEAVLLIILSLWLVADPERIKQGGARRRDKREVKA